MANLWIICLCVLTAKTQKDEKSNPAPPQTTNPKKKETKSLASQPALVSSPIMLPLNFPANTAAPKLTTVTPQPVIVNNQVLFVKGYFLPIVICLACVKVYYVIIYVFGFVSPPGLHSHNPTVNNQPWLNCISWVALPCRDFICNCTRWILAISTSHYFMLLIVIAVDVMVYSVFQLDNRRVSSMPPQCYLELSTGLRSSRSATTS